MNNRRRPAALLVALPLVLSIFAQASPALAVAVKSQPPVGTQARVLPALFAPLFPAARPARPPIEIPTRSGRSWETPAALALPSLPGLQPSSRAPLPPRNLPSLPTRAPGRDAPAAQEESGGVLQKLARAAAKSYFSGAAAGKVFDAARSGGSLASAPVAVVGASGAMALRPLPKPSLPQGIDLDPAPTFPDPQRVPSVSITRFSFDLPTAKDIGSAEDGPRILDADLSDPARIEENVEQSLRRLVDSDAARYGITSQELATLHVQLVKGQLRQADTVWAYFRQVKEGKNTDGTPFKVAIHGSYLGFTVKIVKGKPALMAVRARLYPSIPAGTSPKFTDDELKAKAEQRLPQNLGLSLSFADRKIIHLQGQWRTVNLYDIEGLNDTRGGAVRGIKAAVDVETGDVFTWDERAGSEAPGAAPPAEEEAPAAAPVSGRATGRAEMTDKRPNGQMDLTEQPLPHLQLTLDNGETVVTDKDGRFVSKAKLAKPVTLTATLSGLYGVVNDRAGNPLKIPVTIKPGENALVVFNPQGADELLLAQVNAYVNFNRVLDWLKTRGIDVDKALKGIVTPLNVNIDDECNAYYTPGRPSLNFYRSSKNCSDTSRPGIIAHETGHEIDDFIGGVPVAVLQAVNQALSAARARVWGLSGGIINGGLSEGWGDILSMYLLGSPLIGEGFLKNPGPDGRTWIRDGENDYQYGENDEVHRQGQAWMGFAWKLRKALLASLGSAAGAALAEALVIPVLYSKAADIPAAMAEVLLNDMDQDGNMPHEAEIRAAAKAHGVNLPKGPGGIVGALWNWASSPWNGLNIRGERRTRLGVLPGGRDRRAAPELSDVRSLAETASSPADAGLRLGLSFEAGTLLRGRVELEIGDYAERSGLRYKLRRQRYGVLATEFLLLLEGPAQAVEEAARQIRRRLALIQDEQAGRLTGH